MNDSDNALRHLAAQLLDRLITGLVPYDFKENPDTLELFVERGVVHPLTLVTLDAPSDQVTSLVEPLIVAAPHASRAIVIDAARHARPVYRPVLIHAWLRALDRSRAGLPDQTAARWEGALRLWCYELASCLVRHEWADGPNPASRGAGTAEMAWVAVTLLFAARVLNEPAWFPLSQEALYHIVRRQTPSGALLSAAASDNPETHWYHELLTLHALANFAVATPDAGVRAAVERAARFHMNETQPDHATNQPWALFAFAWHADTRFVADGMLHATTAHAAVERGRPGLPPLTLMLLADALYCARQLLTDPTP